MKNLLSKLATFVTVTVVAVLVWLYAEDANIESYAGQPVRVQFVLPVGAEGLVTPRDAITVLVDFDGSNGQFQQFEQASAKIIEVTLPIDPSLDLETIEIDLRDQIEQAPELKELGINVTGVTEQRTTVTYEKILDVTLDIKIKQRTGSVKLANAKFTPDAPSSVTLQIPASQAKQLNNIHASAWIDEEDVASLDKGSQKQITVDIELPGGLDTLPRSVSTVDLLVTVANDRDTVQIDRRPILLGYPPSINARYIISIDEADVSNGFIKAFQLEGPRDEIEKIKADPASAAVRATVWLSNEEADAAASNGGIIRNKAVDIITPNGVVLTSDIVRVSIKVTPRETPAAP